MAAMRMPKATPIMAISGLSRSGRHCTAIMIWKTVRYPRVLPGLRGRSATPQRIACSRSSFSLMA